MTEAEHYVKYFADHPALQVIAGAMPLIAYGIYYGIKRFRQKNEK